MKLMTTAIPTFLLLLATVNLETVKTGRPYESDDYGFPVKPDSTYPRRTQPRKSFWTSQRAARNLRHSRDYSSDVYRYSRSNHKIKPAIIKSEAEQMGRCIEQAQRELSTATIDLSSKSETVAALKSTEEHLAKAARRHGELHKECCKTSVDRW